MSSYVIPVFPAASRVPPRDALAARLAELTGRFAELSSELAAISSAVASVSGKADKAPPAAAGNLASLDASGNLADSGATPASIKAAAVAEVVANAPGTMDTLKEIADILGSSQHSGTVLKRISDLEAGKAGVDELDGRRGLDDMAVYEPAWDGTDGARTYRFALKSESSEAVLWATGDDPSTAARLTWWADDGGYWTLDVPGAGTGYLQRPGDARELVFEVSGAAWTLARGVEKTADSLAKASQIPAAVAVDATLAVPGAAADAAAVGSALAGKAEASDVDAALGGKRGVADMRVRGAPQGEGTWFAVSGYQQGESVLAWGGGYWSDVYFSIEKTQSGYDLTDGVSDSMFTLDENFSATVQFGEHSLRIVGYVDNLAKTSEIPGASGKADKVAGATAGNLASLAADGNLADSGAKPSDFATPSDLPYALVTPGEWEFSGSGYDPSNHTYSVNIEGIGSEYEYQLLIDGTVEDYAQGATDDLLSASFDLVDITATRPSLPGHLLDRAVNAVSVTGATELTLPELAHAGKSRDLLVRLTVSADSAVTFSASSGETIAWDDAGSPTATYEAGTHLLRFTEVAQTSATASVFHFDDIGSGGSIDPSVLASKLDSTSAAPAFDSTKTYSVGEYVTYEGGLYECSTAVTTAGAWTGSTNWTATDMTTPDATLDLMSDGRLRLVSADGEVLWMQGYALASASSVTLSCDKVNFHAFTAAPAFDATVSYAANDIVAYDGVVYVFTAAHAAGAWTGSDASVYAVALEMPTAPSGKVGDFVLDVDNTANASASATATLTGAGTAFDVFTPEGVNLSTDILTFAGGEQCELYFTMTAFGTAAKPAWKVVKQVVEKQEFGS